MTEQLAIEGGSPIRDKLLSYGRQSIDTDDVQAVSEVLTSNFLTTGPKVTEFEALFAKTVGSEHAIAVNNGTAALHTALFAAGIKEGDEVITTPFTFAASANAVRYLNGTVVFADIRSDTFNIDPETIEKHITTKTRAIIAVDFAGHPADLDKIKEIAKHHNLIVIEDAAHSLGATYKNKQVGACADLTTFSFHPVKHITTGEGGMITTNNPEFAACMRNFRSHGISVDYKQREALGTWLHDMSELGYNYRLSDIQCALGISQLKKLSHWTERRRNIASQYSAAFKDIAELIIPSVLPDCNPSWHLYVVQFKLDLLKVGREKIFQALRAENIGVNVHYIPVPWLTYYQKLGYKKGQWPVTESIYEKIITLPIWPGMTDKDIQDTIFSVKKVIAAYRK